MASLNVGPRGLRQARDVVRTILLEKRVSVLHLQDTKLTKANAKKVLDATLSGIDDYVAFSDESARQGGRQSRGYSYGVATIMHVSIAASAMKVEWRRECKADARSARQKHYERMARRDDDIQNAELGRRRYDVERSGGRAPQAREGKIDGQGRMLVTKIRPIGSSAMVHLVNVYMPTGSGGAQREFASMSRDIIAGCKRAISEGDHVVVQGDFNSDLTIGLHGESRASSVARRNAKRLYKLVCDAGLVDVPHVNQDGKRAPTWRSADTRFKGVLDYVFVSGSVGRVKGTLERQREDYVLDHVMLVTQYQSAVVGNRSVGCEVGAESTTQRVQWRKLQEKSEIFKEMTKGLIVAPTARHGESFPAGQKLMQWGVAAREIAAGLCGYISRAKPREIKLPPGHKSLKRTQTALGALLRKEQKLLSRWNVGRGPSQPIDEKRVTEWRAKHRRRLTRAEADKACTILACDDRDISRESSDERVQALKSDLERLRTRMWEEEREGRKMSLREYKMWIRKRYETGGIKTIMGKRAPHKEVWGLEFSGPVGVVLSRATDLPAAKAAMEGAGVIWHEKRDWVGGVAQDPAHTHGLVDRLRQKGIEFKVMKGGPTGQPRVVFTTRDAKTSCKRMHLQKEGTSSRRKCGRCQSVDVWPIVGRDLTTMLCAECSNVTSTIVAQTPKSPLLDALPRIPEGHGRRLTGSINRNDLDRLLARAAKGKSPGLDDVPVEAYIYGDEDTVRPILLDAINEILTKGNVSEDDKGGMVRFLRKKEPATVITNLRPITLLRCAYKLATSVIHDRLRAIVEDYQLIADPQEGSQRRHSTLRQLQRLEAARARAEKEGKQWVEVQLDFCSAFNSMDHTAMFEILRTYNIPDVELLENLYKDSWYTVAGTEIAERVVLERGVKQGDVLSPMVFALSVEVLLRNWAVQEMPVAGKVHDPTKSSVLCGFVDDMSTGSTSIPRSSRLLEVAEEFSEWSGMMMNAGKCSVSAKNFGTGEAINTEQLRIRGVSLQVVAPDAPTKYLGVQTRVDGRHEDEMKWVLNKMRKDLDAIRAARQLARWQRRALVEMCMRAHFRYSAAVTKWTPRGLDAVDNILCQGYKAAYGLPNRGTDASIMMLSKKHGGVGRLSARVTLTESIESHLSRMLKGRDVLAADISRERKTVREEYGNASWEAIGKVYDTGSGGIYRRLASSVATHGAFIEDPEESQVPETNIVEIVAGSGQMRVMGGTQKNTLRRGLDTLMKRKVYEVGRLRTKGGGWERREVLGLSLAQYNLLQKCVIEHPTVRVGNIRAVEATPAVIGQAAQLPETLRVTFDAGTDMPITGLDSTDVEMLESIVGFNGGHYLVRWSTTEWPTGLQTEDMEKWLRKNKATVIVPYGMDAGWDEYKGGPWTMECGATGQEGKNYTVAEVVGVGSDTGEEEVLGMPSEIFIDTERGSIRWCRAHTRQPERVRADRWVSENALWSKADGEEYPAVSTKMREFWRRTPFTSGETAGAQRERSRYLVGRRPLGPEDEEVVDKTVSIRRGDRPTAMLREMAEWETVTLDDKIIRVDLSSMEQTTWKAGGHRWKARSGITTISRIEENGEATKVGSIETPILAGMRAQRPQMTEEEIIQMAEALMRRQEDAEKTETMVHWDVTTAIGMACEVNVMVGERPLTRDPYYCEYLSWEEITNSSRVGNEGVVATVTGGLDEQALDTLNELIINGTKVIVVITATSAKESQLEERGMPVTRSGVIDEAIRPALPKGSWKTANKDRVKGRAAWELWWSGQLTDQEQVQLAEIIKNGPEEVERWDVISERGNREYGVAYMRSQGGGGYHDFEGARVATDGSLCEEEGAHNMGYGVTSRGKHTCDLSGPVYIEGEEIESSLVPEAKAIRVALEAVPVDMPLVIGTDSVNVLFAIRNLLQGILRDARNVERHPDTLGPVIVALSKRRAQTILVKVDAHKGHQGNERADRLAEMGRRKGDIAPPLVEKNLRICVRRGEDVERHRLGATKKVARQGEEEASLARVKVKHAKKPTKMTKFLLMQNVGIPRIGKAMDAAPLAVVSFQIKSIGGLVPTMRRLAICGMAKTDKCPLRGCGGDEVETIEHLQSMCEALKNARMSAHNAIAETTTSAITDALLCSHPEWKRIHEKTASSVWDAITTSPLAEGTRTMKPDSVVINEKLRRAYILEFNRPWDKDLTTLQDRARRKREHYGPLMEELQRKLPKGWDVTLHPMIVGVRGLTDEAQMTASLKRMRMDEAQLGRVYDVMTREALTQGLMMWRARNACLKGTAEPDKDARSSNDEAPGGGGQGSGPAPGS